MWLKSWRLSDMHSDLQQWWAKSNRDSIQSRFESQRRFDSDIAPFDSSTMRFDTDSIQILTILFKRRAIWTEISKSWLKLNTHSHYSQLTQILNQIKDQIFQMSGFTHHWCRPMPAIIRLLRSSGEILRARRSRLSSKTVDSIIDAT